MAKPWSGWRRSPTSNTASNRGSHPELQEVKMKLMAVIVAALSLIATSWAQGDHTKNERKSKPMQTVNDSRMVAPALEKYAQGTLAGLWKRPGLTPRDRSIVTIAALIARNQTIEMPYYFNLALDKGVKPREISEIITHLAFYSGWENAMSAVAVAKVVFADRKIGDDQLPAASPSPLPLDKEAEAKRATNVEQQFGSVAQGIVQYTTDVLFRDLAASGPCASRSELGDCERADCFWPGCAGHVPPQPGDGQWPNPDAGCGARHALGLLCRLAECLLCTSGPEGCFRETSSLAVSSIWWVARVDDWPEFENCTLNPISTHDSRVSHDFSST